MGYRDSKKTAYINILLIAINVLYFIFLEMTGSSENSLFMIQHGAMYEPLVTENGEYYRLLTSIFMHFGINHIVNNMLMLFILGDNMERALGHIKYLFFYLICGVGAVAGYDGMAYLLAYSSAECTAGHYRRRSAGLRPRSGRVRRYGNDCRQYRRTYTHTTARGLLCRRGRRLGGRRLVCGRNCGHLPISCYRS